MLKNCFVFLVKPLVKNLGKQQLSLFKISPIATLRTDTKVEHTETDNEAATQDRRTTDKMPLKNYTAEQQQKILDIVNKDDEQEISQYNIAKTRLAKLSVWKKRNGHLKNVEQILLIDGFGVKFAEKFYRSMLEEKCEDNRPKRSVRQRSAGFLTPSMDVTHRQEIRSCVSLRVGVSSVTWARLELPSTESANVPCLLTNWQHHEISEKKLHLGDLVQCLLYVDHLIPTADCYIFENPQMAQMSNQPGNADQQNINIQKAQVTAVLAYMLQARGRHRKQSDNSNDITDGNEKLREIWPNVFYLRRLLTARLFNVIVGTERISSEQTILQLMRTYYNVEHLLDDSAAGDDDLSLRGNVQFPQTLRESFASAEGYQREFLGQALLLNLAFVRLVLLQDEQSIAAVTRGQKKGSQEV